MTKIGALGMFSLLALAVACGSTASTSSGSTSSGQACSANSDCADGEGCGFAAADGCSGAKGKCFKAPMGNCAGIVEGCACDGTAVNVACTPYAEGYVSKPLRHNGACASLDGGSNKACTSDNGCSPGEACAYAIADGCGATGKCVARVPRKCAEIIDACACDGTGIAAGCTQLAEGFVSKPLMHNGVCASSDAGADATTD